MIPYPEVTAPLMSSFQQYTILLKAGRPFPVGFVPSGALSVLGGLFRLQWAGGMCYGPADTA